VVTAKLESRAIDQNEELKKGDLYILKTFFENEWVSGEEIAKNLNITRMAVNKKVKRLEQFYQIDAHSKKGYFLKNKDILRIWDVEEYIKNSQYYTKFIYFHQIDSTNSYIKENRERLENATIVFGEKQIGGRGRLGRTWIDFSKGIKFSLLLKGINAPIDRIIPLTLFVGLKIAQSLMNFNIPVQIKWPNDIYLSNKKIGGILTELTGEIDNPESIVVGVGLNVNGKSIPDELLDTATTIEKEMGSSFDRTRIFISILKKLKEDIFTFLKVGFQPFKDDYKALCLNIGKSVVINDEEGECLDIGHNGELICQIGADILSIQSGEVSVKIKNNK